jgi:hypothetical protein
MGGPWVGGGIPVAFSARVLGRSGTRATEALTIAALTDGHCPGAVPGADTNKHPDPNVVGLNR